MGKAEAFVEGYFVKRATDLGAVVRKVEWVLRKGAPDRFVAYDGRQCFIEFKSAIGELSPQQESEMKALLAQGVKVFVASTREQADAILAWLEGKTRSVKV